MKQFGTILKFELKNYFKNKIFVGVTIALVILIAGVMFFPRIQAALESVGDNTGTEDDAVFESGEANTGTEDGAVMLVAADNASDAEQIRDAFATVFTDYNIQIFEGDRNTMEEEITSGKVECAFVFDSLSSYTYYVDNLSMYDSNTYIADEILQNVYRMNAMMDKGITADEASQILSKEIHHEIERLGKDQMENYWYTYIMIFTLYMVILLYGQMVATNVATEKSSRAMELLITSAKPVAMMFGKVIASCLAGLIQLVCVFGSSLLTPVLQPEPCLLGRKCNHQFHLQYAGRAFGVHVAVLCAGIFHLCLSLWCSGVYCLQSGRYQYCCYADHAAFCHSISGGHDVDVQRQCRQSAYDRLLVCSLHFTYGNVHPNRHEHCPAL
jgi:ABC-type Na+ efflux pump permease subunit